MTDYRQILYRLTMFWATVMPLEWRADVIKRLNEREKLTTKEIPITENDSITGVMHTD